MAEQETEHIATVITVLFVEHIMVQCTAPLILHSILQLRLKRRKHEDIRGRHTTDELYR
jgi:hypothetical protein